MIECSNLVKTYGEKTVLNISHLQIKKGETVVIVGPNGSGKSTLLKIISDVLTPSSGQKKVSGKLYYLPQQSIPFSKTVRKNLLMCNKDEARCEKLLQKLLLKDLQSKSAKGLSGGECQRLALGRVLMNNADFLVLDEPSSAADIENARIIEDTIKEYKAETGCGILMTTHSPKQAQKLADRIIMLCDGKIAEEGSPSELLSSPKTAWSKKFIDSWKIDT